MYIFDNEISIENRETLERYLNGYDYEASGLTFTAQYMLRNVNKFTWDIVGDYLCISRIVHEEDENGPKPPFMYPPLTTSGEYDNDALRETIYRCKERFEKKGYPLSFRMVPGKLTEVIKAACPEIDFIDDRQNYDYIYRRQDLVDMKGRAYHSKKNHINYFKKTYEYEYVPLTSGMADEAMAFVDDFYARRDVPEEERVTLMVEAEAMEDVFQNLESAGYEGGAIRIDGKIQARAVGGRLGDDTVVEHIEKANVAYRGLYQTILNEFCRNSAGDVEYINREDDMGIENLRKAKLSYNPVKLLEKYIGVFRI